MRRGERDRVVFVNAGAQELGEGSSDCFLPAADENRFSQFCRAAIEKLTENILEKRGGSTRRTAAEKALKNDLQECRR